MPGRLYRAAPGIAQRRLQQHDARRAQPLPHDAQLGFRLHGDVEENRAAGTVGRASDTEPPTTLGIGPRLLRHTRGRVGEHLAQRGPATQPGQRLVGP